MKRSHRAEPRGASSIARAFEVLELFSLSQPLLKAETVAQRLGYTRSTAYRYIGELCDAGLLVAASGGRYALGPRVIELEQLLRLTDPLYLAACRVLPPLRSESSVLLLQSLYSDKVLCVYAEGPATLEHAGRRITIKRTRGTPFPLFRGAASLALLAWMPADRIRDIYLRHAAEIAERGLGSDWESYRAILAAIRRRGYATSGGQLAPDLFGVAVPVVTGPGDQDHRVIGSLVRIFLREAEGEDIEAEEARCAQELKRIAADLASEFLRASRIGQPGSDDRWPSNKENL